MKKLVALFLAAAMALGLPISEAFAQTASDTVITEDFGDGFVIGDGAVSASDERITVTTGENMFAYDGKTILSKTADGGIYINARQANVSKVSLNFNFDEVTSGKVYLSLNLRMPEWGFANFMNGEELLKITDASGKAASTLYLEGLAQTGNSGYYAKTKKMSTYSEDDYTVGKFTSTVGKNSYIKIEYVFDIDNGKYKIIWDGAAKEFDFENTVSGISTLSLPNNRNEAQYYNKNYVIDDVKIIINSGTPTKTVKFYQNGELKSTEEVAFGGKASFPQLTAPEGMYFSGWYGDAKGQSTVDLSLITEDTNAYAIFKPYIIKEDFGISSSFEVDKESGKITTESGFTISANEAQLEAMSVSNGVLSVNGKNSVVSNNLYIGFDPITEGKAELSFKFSMTGHNGNGNPCGFGIIENNNEGLYAAYQKVGFGTVTNVINTSDAPCTLTKDSAWHKVTYEFDMESGTYNFVFDDVSYGPYTLGSSEVNRICFKGMSHSPSNFNYDLKDICLILNPEENVKTHTVTYVDGEEIIKTETVRTGESATQTPDLAGGDKVFGGWYGDKECTKGVNLSCITSDTTAYAGYVSETAYKEARKAVSLGALQTATIDEKFDNSKMAAAKVAGKSLIYGIDTDGNLFVYDATDFDNLERLGAYEYSLKWGSGLVYHKNRLFAANSASLKIYSLDESGLPTELAYTLNAGSGIKKLEVADDMLFICAGGKIDVYDIKDASVAPKKLVTVTDSALGNSFSVTKISDIRYRVYALGQKSFNKEDKTEDTTLSLMIFDVTNTPQGFTSTKLFDEIPDYSKVNAWPGKGIFGEDETVEDYSAYSSCGNGYINSAGDNVIRITCNNYPTGAANNDDYLIDVSSPKAPKVIERRTKNVYECAMLSLKIDGEVSVEIPSMQNKNEPAYLYDYSKKDYIRTLSTIEGLYGKAVAVLDGVGYVGGTNYIQRINLTADETKFSISPIYINQADGKVAENVRSSAANIKLYAYSPEDGKTVTVIPALYGETDNSLKDVRPRTYTLKSGFNEIEYDIDLNEYSYFDAYSTYLRAYLWDGTDTIEPLAESVKVATAIAEGIEFDCYISPETKVVKGIVLMDRHGIGEKLKAQTAFRNFCAENDWAIVSFTDGSGSSLSHFFDLELGSKTVDAYLARFAEDLNHPELVNAPIATFGHSTATCFSVNYAAANPERCFAAVSFRLHDSIVFTNAEKIAYTVPWMVNQGEIDAFSCEFCIELIQNFNANGGIVNYALDPECSHGMNDWNTMSVIMPFLEAAYEARVPSGVDFTTEKATLKTIDPASGTYLGDISKCYDWCVESKPDKGEVPNQYGSVVYEDKSNEYQITEYNDTDKATHSWLFNEAYAKQWQEFCRTGLVSGVVYK